MDEVINLFKTGLLRAYLLYSLTKNDLCGIEFIKKFRRELAMKASPGTIYPVLHKMEENGLIEGYWETENGVRRKYYKITGRGHKELIRFCKETKGPIRVFLSSLDSYSLGEDVLEFMEEASEKVMDQETT